MRQKGFTSREGAAVEVYVGEFGYVTLSTFGNGTWGGIEINTTFDNREAVQDLIKALQDALALAEGYNGR
jgi:hypothetical protein